MCIRDRDFIGAARPSIADPYLPNKIQAHRIDEIRECIGCNICVSSDCLGVPIRCTQNPTMGEEWRRQWHPEIIHPAKSTASVLVVGAGPAGLECTLQLARRGYHVILSEVSDELGGRSLQESRLDGLSAWKRVRDNRVYEIQQKANVSVYVDSKLSAEEVIELACDKVFLATGAQWRIDGVGRSRRQPIPGIDHLRVFSPEQVMAGEMPDEGALVIYDDELGYLAGVLAVHLAVQLKTCDKNIDIAFCLLYTSPSPRD